MSHFSSFFNALFKGKPGVVTINGKSFSGQSIRITADSKVVVDGAEFKDVLVPPIHVSITGNVHTIDGPVATVSVTGGVTQVTTMSGDVTCGEVRGNVETMSGDITCGDVRGDISTMSGNVRLNSRREP